MGVPAGTRQGFPAPRTSTSPYPTPARALLPAAPPAPSRDSSSSVTATVLSLSKTPSSATGGGSAIDGGVHTPARLRVFVQHCWQGVLGRTPTPPAHQPGVEGAVLPTSPVGGSRAGPAQGSTDIPALGQPLSVIPVVAPSTLGPAGSNPLITRLVSRGEGVKARAGVMQVS